MVTIKRQGMLEYCGQGRDSREFLPHPCTNAEPRLHYCIYGPSRRRRILVTTTPSRLRPPSAAGRAQDMKARRPITNTLPRCHVYKQPLPCRITKGSGERRELPTVVSTGPGPETHAFWGDRLYKSSAVAEMGDRGHNRHRSKRGGCCAPFAVSSKKLN